MKAILAALLICVVTPVSAREFGGHECADDCSGHKAGYEWAETKAVQTEQTCEAILANSPNSTSFYEGCLVYVEEPSRGADLPPLKWSSLKYGFDHGG